MENDSTKSNTKPAIENSAAKKQNRGAVLLAEVRGELQRLAPELVPVLPEHIEPEKFIRVVLTALQKNMEPDGRVPLLEADRKSLYEACMECAADGLLPDGKEGAFVIHKVKNKDSTYTDKVRYSPMIAGLKKKVRQSGLFSSWKGALIYANDKYEIEDGDDAKIKHTPLVDGDRGRLIAVYSIAKFRDGSEPSRHWMPIADVLKIKVRSRAAEFGPWKTDEGQMIIKTCMRQHAKDLELSPELARLIERDDAFYDLGSPPPHSLSEARRQSHNRPTLATVGSLPSAADRYKQIAAPDRGNNGPVTPSDGAAPGPEVAE